MTIARGLALVALLAAVVVVALVLLRNGDTHQYRAVFETAGQLVKGNNVQVGGRAIGSVKKIELTDNNQAMVTFEVQDAFAPLREGTQATIRQASLSGVANRYITLDMAPDNAEALEDGAVIRADDTTTPVDLDQLINTLGPRARKSLQRVISGSATYYAGKGEQANEAAEYFNPALSTTRRVVNELTRDQGALTTLITEGADVTSALSERSDDITNLVTNANLTAQAIVAEREAFTQTLIQLPDTLRRANTTFVNLRATLDDLDVLVEESKPATRELAPLLRELRPLVRDARPTIADLRTLVRRDGSGNDLTDLLNKAPRLEQVSTPSFRATTRALDESLPVLRFARPYTPELVGFFRDFGEAASNYDANGHYARIMPMVTPFNFSENPLGGLLTPRNPTEVITGATTGNYARCPGAASQPNADGSAPWRDTDGELDCDPELVPPGP
ncbi:MAG TPA: MlaD family protein [Capillimicrobium sp.]|jgi:phospholipid/cholesterol/gamma-HCH transport system substrate-binding protein